MCFLGLHLMQRYCAQENQGLQKAWAPLEQEAPMHVGLVFRRPSQDFVKTVEELQRVRLLCLCVMK